MKRIINILLTAILLAGSLGFLLPGEPAFAATESQTSTNNDFEINDSHDDVNQYSMRGQTLTITDRTLTKLTFKLRKSGSPTGSGIYYQIRDATSYDLIYGQLLCSIEDISSVAATDYEMTFDSPIWLNGTYILNVYSSDLTNDGNEIYVSTQSTDVKGGENGIHYRDISDLWVDSPASETYYIYTYDAGGGCAQVITGDISGTGSTTQANSGLLINTTGNSTVTEYGIQLGTTPGAYTSNFTTACAITDNATTVYQLLTGLVSGTTYYYRAEAFNDAGWGYGQEESFIFGTLPDIDILSASKPEATGWATVELEITSCGSGVTYCSSYGINYGSVDGTTYPFTFASTVVSTPIGEYSITTNPFVPIVNGTHIWVQAWATNTNGTSYSDNISFVAGVSEFSTTPPGGADIIPEINDSLDDALTMLGMASVTGKAIASFVILLFTILITRKNKTLQIILSSVAFAAMVAIGWIQIWVVIAGACLIGVILWFKIGRPSHA